MKVYLIGMPGSGKTTLGRQVASELLYEFVDLDHEIEKREQQSISEIFNQRGEDYFRTLESTTLREWAGSTLSFVMATGGGTPCYNGGIEVINQTGFSIFLDVTVDDLLRRLEHKSNRPLLAAPDKEQLRTKLDVLRQSRLPFYRQANVTLQRPTVAALLEKIHFRS